MLSTTTTSDYIRCLHTERTDGIAAYWLEEPGSRTELAQRIGEDLSDLAVLPISVKGGDFDDANGIIDDLARAIETNRDRFTEQFRNVIIRDRKFSLVLISKGPLGVPQLSSPVALPDWFPEWPGRLITVVITSITQSIDLSLGSPDIPAAQICSSLFQLERAICNRLSEVSRADPRRPQKLLARMGGSSGPPSIAALVTKSNQVTLTESPLSFRPGGGQKSPYLVSALFRQWWDSSHAGLHDLSVALAEALGIDDSASISAQYSLASLLTRTAKPSLADTPAGVIFARNALVSLSHGIQFSNAIHHAGDYPKFPAILTVSYAHDVARSCKAAAEALSAHA